jgi:flagellar hook-associated protein 1 FlgK
MDTLITLAQNTLAADEIALSTAAQDTSNAADPTFHAETAVLAPAVVGVDGLGVDGSPPPNGVTVTTVSRATDEPATQGLLQALGDHAAATGTENALAPLMAFFAAGATGGVQSTLQSLEAAWGAFQDAPTSMAAAQGVMGAAQQTVTAVNRLQTTLSQTAQALVAQLQGEGQQFGSLVGQIAAAQAALPALPAGSGAQATAEDQIDALVQQLAKLGGAVVYPSASGGRMVAAPDGGPLWVDGTEAPPASSAAVLTVVQSGTGPWYAASVSLQAGSIGWTPVTGDLAGTLAALDAVDQWGAQLAALSRQLASTVPANASTTLFVATADGGLQMTPGLTGPALSSAVAPSAATALQSGLGAWGTLSAAVGAVGQQATATAAATQTAVSGFQTALQRATGVDPNQAATAVIQDQQAFQAAAQILAVQQQTVQALLQAV